MSLVRAARAGVEVMILSAASNAPSWEMPLGRKAVLEIL